MSIDTMDCQTEIAATIIKGGDYLLAVKSNQPTPHSAVQAALNGAAKTPMTEESVNIEKKHCHIDGREYHVLPAGVLATQFPEWKNR